MRSKTCRKTPKLSYRYIDKPHFYVGNDWLWGQELHFVGNFSGRTEKELRKKRAAVVRDVAKVFEKHGIPAEHFKDLNRWI